MLLGSLLHPGLCSALLHAVLLAVCASVPEAVLAQLVPAELRD
jgi:hypothetical protein